MRRFDEPIQVRVDTAGDTEAAGSAGVAAPAELTGSLVGRPTAFLWRGRLHVVRSVEGHWQERRSWWRGEGEGVAMGDRRVWRVHAQAGRTGSPGIYELGSDGPGAAGPWVLLCAQD